MATFTRNKLSASTNGKSIKVGAVATPGTTIHTAVSGTSAWDEVYCWVTNTSTSPVALTIEFGGTTDPDNLIVKGLVIPPKSTAIPVLTGQIIQNSLVIAAFASATNVLLVTGYVNSIA